MSSKKDESSSGVRINEEAAAWILRSDRGLRPSEQDELSKWLGDDPRHGEAYRRFGGHWRRLDQLGQWLPEHSSEPNPALLAPPLRKRIVRFVPITFSLAAAATVLVCLYVWKGPVHASKPASDIVIESTQGLTSRVLEDGSIVELNSGAAISTHFTPGERRIQLERGEAYFTVAKNPKRPFVVMANGVDVFAVGTAFNVRMDTTVVEVLVTEGKVEVKETAEPGSAQNELGDRPVRPLISALHAQQRAVVSIVQRSEPAQVATLTSGEIERVVGWHHQLLNFTAAPLSEIVSEFNRHNRTQMVIADPEIGTVRISAKFRSDNLSAFVRLIESGFGVQAEYRGESEILLHKAQ